MSALLAEWTQSCWNIRAHVHSANKTRRRRRPNEQPRGLPACVTVYLPRSPPRRHYFSSSPERVNVGECCMVCTLFLSVGGRSAGMQAEGGEGGWEGATQSDHYNTHVLPWWIPSRPPLPVASFFGSVSVRKGTRLVGRHRPHLSFRFHTVHPHLPAHTPSQRHQRINSFFRLVLSVRPFLSLSPLHTH